MNNKNMNEMKIRNINAENKKSFTNIIDGKNREIELLLTPDNERESVEMEDPEDLTNSYVKEDEHGNCIPLKYDALRVLYNNEYVVVEVKEAYTEILVDDNDEPIILKEFGEDYFAENIVYVLGEIIETNVVQKGATPYFYNVEGYDENALPAAHKVNID